MKRFSDWLATRSYIETALVFAVLWGALSLLFNAFIDGTWPDATSIVARAAGAVIFGLILAAISRSNIRRSGGVGVARSVRDAVKAGSLPSEVVAAEWLPPLHFQEQQLARSLWLSPVVFALFTLLGIYIAVSAEDTGSLILGVICIIAFATLAISLPLMARARLPIVRRFIAQLQLR